MDRIKKSLKILAEAILLQERGKQLHPELIGEIENIEQAKTKEERLKAELRVINPQSLGQLKTTEKRGGKK